MNMDETDYQLLVSAMQQNYAEAEVAAASISGQYTGGKELESTIPSLLSLIGEYQAIMCVHWTTKIAFFNLKKNTYA